MADLADADAVAELITRFQASAMVAEEFGGPEHVSGAVEGPWPHIVVGPSGGGDLRGLVGGSIATGVKLEFVSDPGRSVGAAALWRKAMKVLIEAAGYPEQETPNGRPVLADVAPVDYPVEQATVSGQDRVIATLEVVIAPPQV